MSIPDKLSERLTEAAAQVEKAFHGLPWLFRKDDLQAGHCLYSLTAGGKRLRPFLVLESCRAAGGDTQAALPAACAVEMIHTYSLIHDDLPGMDDDDLRRGKPSLHKICGTCSALYAGDRLLLEAFRTLISTPLSEQTRRWMLLKLASAAGAGYLAGGQFMDMYHPSEADRTWTEKMMKGKTSAMIRVSMELGALTAGMKPSELEPVSAAGDDIGWLFQLTDDILDVTGSREEMGKAVAKDSDMGKWNPVSELGEKKAAELAFSRSEELVSALRGLPGDWEAVAALVRYLPERRK
ncbi:hypothetical protein CSA37_01735 [Candidatus Fermentibacteria bacterium]|nr:MAG: hypothetical protein CSA37_01735 [Candidatus Fermentibacteria bacterium]